MTWGTIIEVIVIFLIVTALVLFVMTIPTWTDMLAGPGVDDMMHAVTGVIAGVLGG